VLVAQVTEDSRILGTTIPVDITHTAMVIDTMITPTARIEAILEVIRTVVMVGMVVDQIQEVGTVHMEHIVDLQINPLTLRGALTMATREAEEEADEDISDEIPYGIHEKAI